MIDKSTIDYLRIRSRNIGKYERQGKTNILVESTPAPILQSKSVPCKYLGDSNGELIDCPTCPGISKNGEKTKTRIKTFSCNIYGICTIAKPVGVTKCCARCVSYTPIETLHTLIPITTTHTNLSERKDTQLVNEKHTLVEQTLVDLGVKEPLENSESLEVKEVREDTTVPLDIKVDLPTNPIETPTPILPAVMAQAVPQSIPSQLNGERIHWAYGVTTISSRFNTTLLPTLHSLAKGGFYTPTIYADDCSLQQAIDLEKITQLQVVPRRRHHHDQPGIAWSNYLLALYDLCIRNRNATRVVLFQDDISCPINLRHYLSLQPYPEKGYWNLYSGDENEILATRHTENTVDGKKNRWYRSNQLGRGALALVFDRDTVEHLLGHIITSQRARSARLNWIKNIDGWVQNVLVATQGYTEWCHKPGLVQHRGVGVSTVGSLQIAAPKCYLGDDKDCMELLK